MLNSQTIALQRKKEVEMPLSLSFDVENMGATMEDGIYRLSDEGSHLFWCLALYHIDFSVQVNWTTMNAMAAKVE